MSFSCFHCVTQDYKTNCLCSCPGLIDITEQSTCHIIVPANMDVVYSMLKVNGSI